MLLRRALGTALGKSFSRRTLTDQNRPRNKTSNDKRETEKAI